MYSQTIHRSLIKVEDRQREDLGDITLLAESIKKHGIIHPPLLRKEDNRLVAGGRRLAAMDSLGWTEIPYVYREDMTDEQLAELELEENIRRKSLTWQENVYAIVKLHKLHVRKNALDGQRWGQKETGELLGVSTTPVFNAIRLAEYLDRDKDKKGIWLCDSPNDALRFILREQEDAATRELARRTLNQSEAQGSEYDEPFPLEIEEIDLTNPERYKETFENGRRKPLYLWDNQTQAQKQYEENQLNVIPWEEYKEKSLEEWRKTQDVIPLSNHAFNVDCLIHMSERESSCDHIITDIPYGIDMDNLSQHSTGIQDIESIQDTHTVSGNLSLYERFFPLAFKVIKDKGFLITWCDAMNFRLMHDLAIEAGFRVQRWPLVWHKTQPCLNQMAGFNFTKNFEIALVCRKPNTQLITPQGTSVLPLPPDEMRDNLGHPFVKPYNLWEWLIKAVSTEGQLILEPFAGRGSGTLSMLRLGRRVVSCELDPTHYAHLVENVKQHYIKTIGEHVRFK